MIHCNPVIQRELWQAARQRRTYIIRIVLAGATILMVAPPLLLLIVRGGADWRSLADAARPLFDVTMWTQLIALPVLAAVYARGALQNEWARRTIETLLSTPLSRTGILYGKFAIVLMKIVLAGLALLPVVSLWFRLGRIPPHVALGSIGVVFAGVLEFGAVTYLRAATLVPRGRRGRMCFDLLLVCLLAPFLLGICLQKEHPLLAAAVPYWSFVHVSTGTAPGTMSPQSFALLAAAVPTGLAVLALAVTPWGFSRAFAAAQGAVAGKWRRLLGVRAPRRRSGRPPLKDGENPFAWQEKGPPERLLGWGPVVVTALVAGIVALVGVTSGGSLLDAVVPGALIAYGIVLVVAMNVLATAYAAGVFAREKVRQTAQALVLTGHAPRTFLFAKLQAVFRASRVSYVLLALLIAGYIGTEDGDASAGAIVAWLLAGSVGVALSAFIGMAFSVAAGSPWQAVGAYLLGFPAWLVGQSVLGFVSALLAMLLSAPAMLAGGFGMLGFVLSYGLILLGALGTMILIAVLVKRWNVWLVWLMWSLNLVVLTQGASAVTMLAAVGRIFEMDKTAAWAALLLLSAAVGAGLVVYWYFLSARMFDRCMRGEAGLTARRVVPAALPALPVVTAVLPSEQVGSQSPPPPPPVEPAPARDDAPSDPGGTARR